MVEQREFRADLYYRLNIFPLVVPPLRDRSDDIPPLVEYFVARFAERLGRRVSRVDRKTMELLQGYHWPGNIRELQNVIERSVILAEDGTLRIDAGVLESTGSLKTPPYRGCSTAERKGIDRGGARRNQGPGSRNTWRCGAAAHPGVHARIQDPRAEDR
jgi:transcriptional regulator with PAS, ATPase and Fis domain